MIITGEKPNEIWDLSDSSDDSEREEDGQGKGRQEQSLSELQGLFSAINSSNGSLMKLSMVIRSSPARDDYVKAAARFKDWNPYADINHVREKHGSAKGSTDLLLNRLGKAITRRRQFLRYRVEHFEKLSGTWDDEEKEGKTNDKPEKTIASTKATTFMGNDNIYQREGSDTAGSFGSQTSYEATVLGDENASRRLTVPPPPRLAFPDIPFEFGEPFNCPYCYTEQTVKNKAAWKNHVFRDLKPYVCTFEGCDMKMYKSRNDWFAHELQNHRRQWVCQYCRHGAFTTSTAFSKHVSSSHPRVLANSQMEAILLQSEEAVDNISAFACPLCDDWETNIKLRQGKQDPNISMVLNGRETVEPHGTKNQFRRHLGRHMEQLALFALPMSEIDELENDSTDDDEGDSCKPSLKGPSELSEPNIHAKKPRPNSVASSRETQAEEVSSTILPQGRERDDTLHFDGNFGNRYDFGASLSSAMDASNNSPQDLGSPVYSDEELVPEPSITDAQAEEDALLPIYNQLQTLRRCLIEVKSSGGVQSPRDLYPYSTKLNSIASKRVDGKFMVGGGVPQGQGSVNDLLAECFKLNYELRLAAETASDNHLSKEKTDQETRTSAASIHGKQEEQTIVSNLAPYFEQLSQAFHEERRRDSKRHPAQDGQARSFSEISPIPIAETTSEDVTHEDERLNEMEAIATANNQATMLTARLQSQTVLGSASTLKARNDQVVPEDPEELVFPMGGTTVVNKDGNNKIPTITGPPFEQVRYAAPYQPEEVIYNDTYHQGSGSGVGSNSAPRPKDFDFESGQGQSGGGSGDFSFGNPESVFSHFLGGQGEMGGEKQ